MYKQIGPGKFELEVNRQGKKQKSSETIETLLEKIIIEVKQQINVQNCFLMNLSTGIGKSTQFIYELFKHFPNHKVICSQVTVINTIDLCKFVAQTQPGMELGRNIGYSTGAYKKLPNDFHSIHYQTQKLTTLKYLIEIQNDRLKIPQNYIIVIDEAHTNDVNSQEQLAIIRELLLTKRKDQLPFFIIQSASINLEEFMQYFQVESYLQATGSRFPVEELFLDDFKLQKEKNVYNASVNIVEQIIQSCYLPKQQRIKNKIHTTITTLNIENPSSILIFIAKQKQATNLEKMLRKSEIIQRAGINIIFISAQSLERDPLQISRQDNSTPKIFIATNVIETGYTIQNITFVIDLLKYKMLYRNPVSKINVIRDNPIDKQMQQQRRGRVGRTQPGVYIGICTQKVSDALNSKRELSIQLSNIQSNIIQFEHGIHSFLQLKFMKPIPSEHYLDYLQITSMIGQENISNTKHNIVQNLLFSSIRFSDFRQILLLVLAINVGIRPLDVILVLSYILTSNRFRCNREIEVNDFKAIYEIITQGRESDQKMSEVLQQLIILFKDNTINIYKGIPLTEPEGLQKFATCMSIVYYFFMFKHKSGDTFISKQGLTIKIKLPSEIKYFVSMVVELKETYQCKYITPITSNDWDILPCKL